jgi:hypothetical protein
METIVPFLLQYERLQQAVRKLGIDEKKSRETFEQAFRKIVPPRAAKNQTKI